MPYGWYLKMAWGVIEVRLEAQSLSIMGRKIVHKVMKFYLVKNDAEIGIKSGTERIPNVASRFM